MRINNINLRQNLPLKPFTGKDKNLNIILPSQIQTDTFELKVSHPKADFDISNTKQASTDKLETIIQEVITNGCKLYGIPEELRPKLIVIDSIQFASKEEINQKFGMSLNQDKDGINTDLFSDSTKSPLEMTRKEFINYISKKTNLSKKDVEEKMKNGNGKDKGFYSSADNSITYYTDGIRFGKDTIESTIFHELYHAKEAIVRSSLPQETRNGIVKQALLQRLTQRETRNVFKQLPEKGDPSTALMTVPIFDNKTQKKLIKFAENNLFTSDSSLYEKMHKYSELLHQEEPDKKELAKAKADLNGLAEQIEEISKKSKIDMDSLSFFESVIGLPKEKKNKLIFDYMLSVEFRYQYFRQKEIADVPEKPATKEEITAAQQSMSEHIGSTQANYAMAISSQNDEKMSTKTYRDYYESREEVKARLNSELKEISVKYKNENEIKTEIERKIQKKLDTQFNNCELKMSWYEKFFKAEDMLKANPNNIFHKMNYYYRKYLINLSKYIQPELIITLPIVLPICLKIINNKSNIQNLIKSFRL